MLFIHLKKTICKLNTEIRTMGIIKKEQKLMTNDTIEEISIKKWLSEKINKMSLHSKTYQKR